jgi:mRNA interferase MazF
MTFKPGTVVLIPFPFSDLTGLKQRPALVLSSETSQQETKQIICMMITSAKSTYSTDYILTSWQESGLLKPSVIKVNRVFTINADLIKKTLGGIPENDFASIRSILFRVLHFQTDKD